MQSCLNLLKGPRGSGSRRNHHGLAPRVQPFLPLPGAAHRRATQVPTVEVAAAVALADQGR